MDWLALLTVIPDGKPDETKKRPVGKVAIESLKRAWAIRLKRSGFQDLEAPGLSEGRLSQRGCASHLYERDSSRAAEVLEDTREYYTRLTHLCWRLSDTRLPGVNDPGDRAVGLAVADGWSIRRIKTELGVGQPRIERVTRELRAMARERQTDEEDDDDGDEDKHTH